MNRYDDVAAATPDMTPARSAAVQLGAGGGGCAPAVAGPSEWLNIAARLAVDQVMLVDAAGTVRVSDVPTTAS